jgi:pimeloyl-ACP methyl ester carboxylesterase
MAKISRQMRSGLFLVFGVALCVTGFSPAAAAKSAKTASLPVTFTVQNVNQTKLACATDGATYQIKGHLTGPASVVKRSGGEAARRKRSVRKRAVTLYLHGLGFGEWMWHFTAIPAYDYATLQARAGHVSVTVDRLGYDASGRPEGKKSCLAGQASIAHQVIGALRNGTYTVEGGRPVKFRKVALAGHSIGVQIAMIEAYSFRDISALVLVAFSYQNLPRAQVLLGPTYDLCKRGGEPAEPGSPSGYAPYGLGTPADFQSAMFSSAPQSVIDAAIPLRNRDPCGDTDSIIASILHQRANLPKVKIPVLLVCGAKDLLFSPAGCNGQAQRFTGTRRISVQSVRGAGHAITLERPATTFRRKVSRWLEKRGF